MVIQKVLEGQKYVTVSFGYRFCYTKYGSTQIHRSIIPTCSVPTTIFVTTIFAMTFGLFSYFFGYPILGSASSAQHKISFGQPKNQKNFGCRRKGRLGRLAESFGNRLLPKGSSGPSAPIPNISDLGNQEIFFFQMV